MPIQPIYGEKSKASTRRKRTGSCHPRERGNYLKRRGQRGAISSRNAIEAGATTSPLEGGGKGRVLLCKTWGRLHEEETWQQISP